MKIAIIGGGPECKELLLLLSEYATDSKLEIAAIIDQDPNAPGMVLGQELGISTFDDYGALEDIKKRIDVIIDLTDEDPHLKRERPSSCNLDVAIVNKKVIKLFLDIIKAQHQRITLQKQLAASDSVIAVSKIIFHLTHVIRNSLVITGTLIRRLLLDDKTHFTTKKTLKKILKHVEDMEDALRHACETSLISTPKLREEDLFPILNEWCYVFCAEARRYDIKAKCQLEQDLPKVFIDRDLFYQVLWHIAEYTLEAIHKTASGILFEARLCWDEIVMVFREEGDAQVCDPKTNGGATVPVIPSRRSHAWLDLCTKIMFEHGGDVRMERKGGKLLSIITIPIKKPTKNRYTTNWP